VREICQKDDYIKRYYALFDGGFQSVSAFQADLSDIFGEAWEDDPSLGSIVSAAVRDIETPRNLDGRKNICSGDTLLKSLPLDQMIISCLFAFFDDLCTIDNDFEFELRTLTWDLPKVRFEYDVSPPPPPPAGLSVKQQLLELDPHGFELARKKLEEVYPTLEYVATSSAGAAVGDFKPPYEVSPQQLTRALLASRNADGDGDDNELGNINSLAARIIQSQHTGIWRLACRTLVDFFNDPKNAGRGSLAPEGGDPSWSAPEHDSPYDRNLLLYVTVEVAVALRIPDKDFEVSSVWRRMCDHGGYLVPTYGDYKQSYQTQDGALVTNFLPIVAYGSLELLRSAAWASGDRSAVPFWMFREDVVRHLRLSRRRSIGRWLQHEETSRFKYAPAAMQARYCDSELDMTVDDALGNPRKAPSFLYDIYKDERITQGSTGAELSAGSARTVEKGGVWMYATVDQLEAETVTDKYRQLNLNSHVYVTSSHDPNIPPGIHRLLDLAVFADEDSCRTTAYAKCRSPRYGFFGDWWTTLKPPEDYAPRGFVTGAELFVRSRYHEESQSFLGAPDPNTDVFAGLPGCASFQSTYMVYGSAQGDTKVSVPELVNRLRHPTPPPPQPPAPPSPPPSTPPPSPPPPDAPLAYLRSELRERVFEAEKAFCTQVYWRTVDERCDELSIALTTRYHVDELPPPSPPPEPVAGSPPPLPPPSPPLDDGLADVAIAGATLTTIRRPNAYDPTTTQADWVYDGLAFGASEVFVPAAVATLDADQRVRCVGGDHDPAALPCVSAVREDNCLDGTRACDRRIGGTDDAERRNSKDPVLELRLEAQPRFRGAFLHSVKLHLPQAYELASLFFTSNERIGGSGYRIEALRGDGSVAATATDIVDGVPDSRELEVLFAPTDDDDATLRALSDVGYVRITLPGDFRQIWLQRAQVVEKKLDLASLSPAPPSPPPRPHSPPAPPESTASCLFAVGTALDDRFVVRQDFDRCDISEAECCKAAATSYSAAEVGQNAVGYIYSDHGCCSTMITTADAANNVVVVPFLNFQATGGVGFVN